MYVCRQHSCPEASQVQASGADIPLAVALPLPIGELAPKEEEVRLAVILPLGELLP